MLIFSAKSYRGITRLENEAVLDRMADRLATRPGILDISRESVEHPFGTVKQWMDQGAFLMRSLGYTPWRRARRCRDLQRRGQGLWR
ncbi:MAG TPA: hypothetical protein VGC14_19275 [Rhizobium sp.]